MNIAGKRRKLHRDGDWWAQEGDGSWLRWNPRRNDWEPYPVPPPGESNERPESSHFRLDLPRVKSVVEDFTRVYGFLFLTAVVVFFGAVLFLGVGQFLANAEVLDMQPPSLRKFVIEAPPFILLFVLFVGAGAVYLIRSPMKLWDLRMVAVSLAVSLAITTAHWAVEPAWVEPNKWNVLIGWGVVTILGHIWSRQLGIPSRRTRS